MLYKILELKKIFDMTPHLNEREIINEDKYIEKYKQRIDKALEENWINEIPEFCNQEERENYRINNKKEYSFPFGYTKNKTVFHNEKYDKDIVLILESKQYVLTLLDKKKEIIKNKSSLDLIDSYIELIERIYYIDMFECSKINAYRVYDNLKILRELFRDMSILFVRKFHCIEKSVNTESEINYKLLTELEEYESYIENCSFEIFYNLENILEGLYLFYMKKEESEKIEKTKSFFLNLLIEIYVKWMPVLDYLDSETERYINS